MTNITIDAITNDIGGVTSINGAGYNKNIAINSGFTINQGAYVSGAVLASGSYGHDQWKAGAGGGDYTFTQLASNTTITIAANKTLIQPFEDKGVLATRYVVSWTGTALGRVGVNSLTPSGAYAASPIVITGQTAGTAMSIEFGNGASAGTLGSVMVEATTGSTPSAWTPYGGIFGGELQACQRYCQKPTLYTSMLNEAAATRTFTTPYTLAVPMRVTPTVVSSGYANISSTSAGSVTGYSQELVYGSFTAAVGLVTCTCSFAPLLTARL
jgi:hypothetical protein